MNSILEFPFENLPQNEKKLHENYLINDSSHTNSFIPSEFSDILADRITIPIFNTHEKQCSPKSDIINSKTHVSKDNDQDELLTNKEKTMISNVFQESYAYLEKEPIPNSNRSVGRFLDSEQMKILNSQIKEKEKIIFIRKSHKRKQSDKAYFFLACDNIFRKKVTSFSNSKYIFFELFPIYFK